MKKNTISYEENSLNLIKAIDIAIEVIKEMPPKSIKKESFDIFLQSYLDFKHARQTAEKKFQNNKSLSYDIEAVFTYFQEVAEETTNLFWKRIKESGLPYKRENRLVKILKRGKIKNDIEFDFIIDIIQPYEADNIITTSDVILLNKMIADFENKK
ncbi:MAG: hypothetical protein ABL940_10825 [Bacteroidia bacterium]